MNIVFFDDPSIKLGLLPFTWIRPVASIRIGILKIYEKWINALSQKVTLELSFLTEEYLSKKFPANYKDCQWYINGAVCPNSALLSKILTLKRGEGIQSEGVLLAYCSSDRFNTPQDLINASSSKLHDFITIEKSMLLKRPWDIFQNNHNEILADFELVVRHRRSAEIKDPYTKIYASENVFVEEGASIKAAIINAESGPIYIGKNAKIHEGAIVKGSLALCEGAEINMGAKIRGKSTFGPYAKVGGEVNNSVIFGYSNKGHDGYLGNAVLGEWCNLGADTNGSNLKNNYSEVKIWDYNQSKLIPSGQQFCGLLMGDHSKCGINTMFNTGTVVGIASIIFGSGFPQKFVPSFSWGGIEKIDTFKLDKMMELAETVMNRKGVSLTSIDKKIFEKVYEHSSIYRNS